MYGDYEPPFYHFSKGLGFEEIYKLYENGEVNQFGEVYFNDSGHKYILPQYLKTKLELSSKHNLYPDSVITWKNDKGFSDLDAAAKNRSSVVERTNIQKIVARGKCKQDYKQAEENIMIDRQNKFIGFQDYSTLDSQIGFVL